LTAAILFDKSGGLEEAAQRAQERQVALAEAQAERIAAAVRWLVEDVLGLSLDTIPRSVMRQAILGQDLTMPADAEAARRSIRQQIGSQLQAHAPQLEEDDGQRALPAPNDD
jgi:hypothetical protein